MKQVELTWDENDVDRMELNEKLNTGKLNEIPDSELRKFVAYSSDDDELEDASNINENDSEEEEENDQPNSDDEPDSVSTKKSRKKNDVISKYKNLLNDINKKEAEKKKNKVEMEFSWGVDTKTNPFKTETNDETSKNDELTPFEKIIEKKREKKRARKEKIRQLKKGQNQSGESGSDDDDLPDGIDLNDPYFAEEFANGEFEPLKKKNTKSKKSHKNDGDDIESDTQKDLELLLDDDDHKAHFSLKKIQERENESKTSKKRRNKTKKSKTIDDKKVVEDNFQINVADDRFSAIYSSHLFNIDPTDSHFKKTKAMETLIQEKLKRKASDTGQNTVANDEPSQKKHKDVANSILVKSIKRKVKLQK